MTGALFAQNLGATSGNGQWLVCCPAHEDSTPSLSVKQGRDKILLHCKAGCNWREILDAMGLDASDLFSDAPGKTFTFNAERSMWAKIKSKHDKMMQAERFWEASGYLL
mgnify:FL=1